MSLATTRAFAALAIAMARTPDPVPRSSAFRIGRVPGDAVDLDEAGGRRAVMPRTERLTGLDLDTGLVHADGIAIVSTVDDEPPRAHRRESFEALGDPVDARKFGETQDSLSPRMDRSRSSQRLIGSAN